MTPLLDKLVALNLIQAITLELLESIDRDKEQRGVSEPEPREEQRRNSAVEPSPAREWRGGEGDAQNGFPGAQGT